MASAMAAGTGVACVWAAPSSVPSAPVSPAAKRGAKARLAPRLLNGACSGLTALDRRIRGRPTRGRNHRAAASASAEAAPGISGDGGTVVKPTSVLEHIVLFKLKGEGEAPPNAEVNLLDNLFSLQYLCPNVLSISVGVNFAKRSGGFTHALFVRFPDKAALDVYMTHPEHVRVVQNVVLPSIDDLLALDYVCEVHSEMEEVFRRGDEYETGVEHIVLIKVKDDAPDGAGDQLMDELRALPGAVGDTVVQLTAGSNITPERAHGFTHGMIARFRDNDDLEAYNKHPSHRAVLRKMLPIAADVITIDFQVAPPKGRETVQS